MYPDDRPRFLWPVIVTLIAVPLIWWASQRDDSGDATGAAGDTIAADTGAAATSPLVPEPVGDLEPVYLDGPEGGALPGLADIAVPAQGELALYQDATYSSAVPPGICTVRGAGVGNRVNVVNLENNRSIVCVAQLGPPEQEEDLVLSRSAFLQLADLTDAPIPVELRR